MVVTVAAAVMVARCGGGEYGKWVGGCVSGSAGWWVGRLLFLSPSSVSCFPDAERCGGMPKDAEGCETAHSSRKSRPMERKGSSLRCFAPEPGGDSEAGPPWTGSLLSALQQHPPTVPAHNASGGGGRPQATAWVGGRAQQSSFARKEVAHFLQHWPRGGVTPRGAAPARLARARLATPACGGVPVSNL